MPEVGPWGRARTFVNADTLGLVIVSLFKISNYKRRTRAYGTEGMYSIILLHAF